jgi:hypothetical protein
MMANTEFDSKATHVTMNKAIRFKGEHVGAGASIAKADFKEAGEWKDLVLSGAAEESTGSGKAAKAAPAAPAGA